MGTKECKCEIPNTDLSGRCFKCGGNLIFFDKANTDTQLPSELVSQINSKLPHHIKVQIEQEAEALTKRYPGNDGVYIGKRNGIEIGYMAAGDKYARQVAALQAKCERYENVLKGIVKKVHSRHITDGDNRLANELCNEANEALSAGEGEKEPIVVYKQHGSQALNQKEDKQ